MAWMAVLALWLPSAIALEPSIIGFTPDGFRIPQADYAFSFPSDHGSHPEYKVEWWYITGHLKSGAGKSYGFQATFFRFALGAQRENNTPFFPEITSPDFGYDQLYMAHMAVSDCSAKTFFHEERINRGGWDAWSQPSELNVQNGNWSLNASGDSKESADPDMRLRFTVLSDLTLELELIPTKPRVIFGDRGVSVKGPAASARSYYITYPRLRVSGTLTASGTSEAISGEAWMDHEISSSQLSPEQAGWNWAGIQLNDGREIMVYVMRTRDGEADPWSTMAWIDRDGGVRHVGADDFSWHTEGDWRSSKTGIVYPIHARIESLDPETGEPVTLRLEPAFEAQELTGKVGGIAYWEGACRVRNASGAAIGRAYMELAGFDNRRDSLGSLR